ncbi:MAG: hypothetical protein J2P52_03950 [Blastocatellia bacterium]|nr:hypothetical protein [Blastocatellia bacterium]
MLADIVKIHCLKHHAAFPMPRTSRVVICKEGGDEHTLSDNFPYSGSWIYCCNCQTFIAWEIGRANVSVKQCPFCLSTINPRLYTCDHCSVTMLDFDDPALRKHHKVLNWGMPQPACPACQQFPDSTPKQHYCRVLQVNLATARPVCPFCDAKVDEAPTDGVRSMAARFGAALADAEARLRDAEERRRLAEDAARKEIELRVQAERKADEIEKKSTREFVIPSASELELARREAIAKAEAKAEAEARAKLEAEQRAYAEALERQEAEWRKAEAEARAREAEERAFEIEERRRRAEATARKEAELREMAEMQARQLVERFTTGNLPQPQPKAEAGGDKLAIALYSGIAIVLLVVLVLIVYMLVQYI